MAEESGVAQAELLVNRILEELVVVAAGEEGAQISDDIEVDDYEISTVQTRSGPK